MNIRLGRLAVMFEWYSAEPWMARRCYSIHKWSWRGVSSWRHGSARIGKIKIVW